MAKKIFDFDTELNFGKHKGQTPEELLEDGDASYLIWMSENVKWATLTDALYDEACDATENEQNKHQSYSRQRYSFSSDGYDWGDDDGDLAFRDGRFIK